MPAHPPIVDLAAWETALADHAQQEEALRQQTLATAAARRRLPMTPVQGEYTFTGPDGACTLADVFGGRRQLAIYHFMFAPDWERGCPACTQYARNIGPGVNDDLAKRDTRFILTSRAPYGTLAAWAAEKQISTPWYSAPTAWSEEMGAINDEFGDYPRITVLFRDDDNRIFRTFRSENISVETTMPANGILRMTPWGMQEKGEDSPAGWPQTFDRYD